MIQKTLCLEGRPCFTLIVTDVQRRLIAAHVIDERQKCKVVACTYVSAYLFVYFSYFITYIHTYIHPITFIRHHSPGLLSIPHRFQAQWENLPVVPCRLSYVNFFSGFLLLES